MTKAKLKELTDRRNELWAEMQAIAERGFEDPLNREQYEKLEAELDDVVEPEITSVMNHLERTKAFADRTDVPIEDPGTGEVEDTPNSDERYAETFDTWLRYGVKALDSEERGLMQARAESIDGSFDLGAAASGASQEERALGTVSGTAGGFTVPEGFWNQIVEARLAFGGIRNAPVFKLVTGSGNDIPIPTGDDTANVGVYIAENTQITEQDVDFNQKVLKAFTITSRLVRVPIQLLQDSAFDIGAYVAQKLGERIGRGEADKFINGSGLQEPEGLVTAAPTGFTAPGTDTFVYSDFVEMQHSVDPAYRNDPSTAWLFHDDALKAARLITVSSTDSRPLWQPGMVAGEPNMILGDPYFIDQEMPTVATGNSPVAYGALRNYWIRDVQGVQLMRLDERYAEFLQVAFLAFARNDGRLVDAGTNPIKLMTMT